MVEERPLKLIIHGSLVSYSGQGILIKGPSGSGKSLLALRLINEGAVLVADDRVEIWAQHQQIKGRCPALPGYLEIRHQGIFNLPYGSNASIVLCINLCETLKRSDRLPLPAYDEYFGIRIPIVKIDPHHSASVAIIKTVLNHERVD